MKTSSRGAALSSISSILAMIIVGVVINMTAAATRTWIGGNADWVDNGITVLWNPSDEPDPDDEAVFNTPNTVNLGTSNSIQALTLSGGIDLLTNGQDLTVDGAVTASGAGTIFFIDTNTSLVAADTVAINSGATIRLRDGTLAVDEETGTGFLDINAGGTFSGNGIVNLNDAPGVATSLFINDGTLTLFRDPILLVPPAGTLTINATAANARINLDGGAEAGVVNINRNQSLEINGTLADAFSGDLNMFHDTTLDISTAWSMDGGTLDVVNGFIDAPFPSPDVPAGTATIAGGLFTKSGGTILNFNSDGTLIFDAAFTQSGGNLVNNGLVVFNANTFIGAASNFTLPTNTSSITVGPGAVVEVNDPNFDVDGNGTATNVITIQSGGNLDLDMGVGGDDTITGTVVLSGGELDVTTLSITWSLGGSVSTVASSGTSQLNGETLTFDGADVSVASGSTLDVNAANIWEAVPGDSVVVDGTLALDGAATFNSDSDQLQISGTGTLRIGSTSSFSGPNVFFTIDTFDWDGTTTGQVHTIQPNSNIRMDITSFDFDGDMDDSLTMGARSALRINDVAQWEMLGTLTTNGVAEQIAFIGGDARMVVRAAFNVNGDTGLENVAFWPGSTTTIAAGAVLSEGVGIPGDYLYDGGTITGAGTFIPAAGDHNTMPFFSSATISVANFDLDAGNWLINSGSTLTVNVTDYDTDQSINRFDSTITLDGGTINMNTADAEFVMDGTLIMDRPLIDQPAWTGEPLDIGNDDASTPANLNILGTAGIGSQVDFNADANVTIEAGATLLINDTANFDTVNGVDNASFTGGGRFVLNQEANFNEATTFDMAGGEVDFDGTDLAENTINLDAPVTINAETFASFGNANVVGGADTLVIDNDAPSGTLTVNLDDPNAEWTLNSPGVLHLVNDNFDSVLLNGSDVNLNGTVNVTGDVVIDARVDFGATGVVNINTLGENLRLRGGGIDNVVHTIAGAVINGPGRLISDQGDALAGFGTINADVSFAGAGELVADGGVLDVNGTITEVGTIRIKSGATLDLALPLDTTVTDNGIVMEGGTLEGGPLTIDSAPAKSLRGFGTLNNGDFNNNGTIEALDGTLVVVVDAQTSEGDLDGTSDMGRLRAAAGANLTIREFSGDGLIEFAGTVEVENGGELLADFVGGANAFMDFIPGSSMTLTGATFRTNTFIGLTGSMVVGSGPDSLLDSTLDPIATFDLKGAFTLNGNLQVKSHGFIPEGATFSGAGALHLLEESFYDVNDGADIGVLVINEGIFNIEGISQGRVDVADYQQSSAGSFVVTLEGTNLNEFDRLVVDGAAQLNGALDLFLTGGFVPNVGDTFPILSASAGVSGAFTSVLQPANMPAGLLFDVVYSPTLVQLMVVNAPIFSADFDNDGDVDSDDLDEWQAGYGIGTLQTQGDADGDGDVDGRDFLAWQHQFGSVPLQAVTASVAVPEPAVRSTLSMVAAILALWRRRFTL